MNPAPPVTRISRTLPHCTRSAEGAEEVRDAAQAGEYQRDVETAVGGQPERCARLVVEVLEFGLDAAALRHVRRGDGLVDDVAARQVPADDVRAGDTPFAHAEVRRSGE